MPGQQNCQQEVDAGEERLREAAGPAHREMDIHWIKDIHFPNSASDNISDVRLDGASRKRLREGAGFAYDANIERRILVFQIQLNSKIFIQ